MIVVNNNLCVFQKIFGKNLHSSKPGVLYHKSQKILLLFLYPKSILLCVDTRKCLEALISRRINITSQISALTLKI